jgi:hypothetical protein
MALKDCIDEVARAAGRDLTDKELNELVDELAIRVKERRARATIESAEEASRAASSELADDLERGALIAKRQAAIAFKTRVEAVDFVKTQWKGKETEGLLAILEGRNRESFGGRSSIAADQLALDDHYVSGFTYDVENVSPAAWKLYISGTIDEQIAVAREALDLAPDSLKGMMPEAVGIAKAMKKWQEKARIDANDAGAFIGKIDGYVIRQSHNMWKIRADGFDAWRAMVEPRLDVAKTFGDATNYEEALTGIWDGLASGVHLKPSPPQPGFKGASNIAKRLSASRELHFRSAKDWHAYHKEYGYGTIAEAMKQSFEISAQNTALMRKLGANPGDNLDRIVKEIAKGIDDVARKAAFVESAGERGPIKNSLAHLDGTLRIPVDGMVASMGSNVRKVQDMAKLGGATISAFVDPAIMGTEVRYQGGTMLGGMAEAMTGLFQNRKNPVIREVNAVLEVVAEDMMAAAHPRFSLAEDGASGLITRWHRNFFKVIGLTGWTDRLSGALVRGTARRMALHAGTDYNNLNRDFQRVIRLHGIDEKRWNVIRQAARKEADGRDYVSPQSIEALPDNLFTPLMGKGRPSARRTAKAKRDLADQIRRLYIDRANVGVIKPDVRTRRYALGGTRRGTFDGELRGFIMHFKSFPIGVLANVVGREVYGRGSDTLMQALRNGNGEMLGLANLILSTTVLGYVAMATKDIAKGRGPRDPKDPKTWAAAMIQGGGAGIYGDFLFGEMRTRYGGGPISTALGPEIGMAEDILDVIGRARNGDDVAAATMRTILSNTPYANLIYTKAALDYLIMYRIQESLNPGSVRRMEQRIKKENNQEFLMSPSAYAR